MKTLNNKSQSFKVKNMDSASMPLPSVTTASAQGFLCKIQTFNGHYLTAVGGGGRNYESFTPMQPRLVTGSSSGSLSFRLVGVRLEECCYSTPH
jgi:hypothetical protein